MANLVYVPPPFFPPKLQRPQLDCHTSIVPLALSDSYVLLYVRHGEC